jgi:hypothetical protein
MIRRVIWDWHRLMTYRLPHLSEATLLPPGTSQKYDKIPDALDAGCKLGHGAMAAQQTLDLFILVRARMPQLVTTDDICYD